MLTEFGPGTQGNRFGWASVIFPPSSPMS